jgi:hypothetical protein
VAMALDSRMTVSWKSHAIRESTLLGSHQCCTPRTKLTWSEAYF